MTTKDLAVIELPSDSQADQMLQQVEQFQALVQSRLRNGHDYGVIPGTGKPTLLKPGAEKLTKLLGLADHYEIINQIDEWDKYLFRYMIRCSLVSIRTGDVVAQGLGECNSYEEKYRWRKQGRKCPVCEHEGAVMKSKFNQGEWYCWAKKDGCGANFPAGSQEASDIESQEERKVQNEDVFSQVNTILKMAKKRALVDAALSVGRLSDLFTQDMEDIRNYTPEPEQAEAQAPQPRQSAPKPSVQRQPNANERLYSRVQDELDVPENDVWPTIREALGMKPGDHWATIAGGETEDEGIQNAVRMVANHLDQATGEQQGFDTGPAPDRG